MLESTKPRVMFNLAFHIQLPSAGLLSDLHWFLNQPILRLIALTLAFCFLVWWAVQRWLRRPLPNHSGTLQVQGVTDEVTISRDSFGVPTVEASSIEDVLFGQGFAQAQDRLWQMELNRRVGSGRISEIVGEDALPADIYLRRLGLVQAAQADLRALTEQEENHLKAFSEGVNAGIRSLSVLPAEFQLLKFRPEEWHPLDTLTWVQVMSMDLCANWEQELLRGQILEKVPLEVAELLHLFQKGCAYTLPPGSRGTDAIDRLGKMFEEAKAFLPNGGLPGGSNAWVVSGQRTRSGKPLLANDPHLVGRVPSIWYESRLIAPGLDVRGASFPGVPFVVIGANPNVSWGITNSYADTMDLYIEKFSSDNQDLYQTENGWMGITRRTEIIPIKGKESHLETVEGTRHGPLLARTKESGIALRWMNYEPANPVETLLKMNLAGSTAEFKEALRTWQAPSSNFVFADASGNIGYLMAGQVPKRKKGTGLTPVPGWDGKYEWDGLIPFEELPQADNPECGYIVTANNPVVGNDYPHHLSWDWMGSARAERIEELLLAQPKFSVEEFVEMQVDVHCSTGLRFARLCQNLTFQSESATKAQEMLAQWDGSGHPESEEMALYEVTFLKIANKVCSTVLGQELGNRLLGQTSNPLSEMGGHTGRYTIWLVQLLEDDESFQRLRHHCPNLAEKGAIIEKALTEAYTTLAAEYGSNPKLWEWGKLHRLQFRHALGVHPILGSIFNGPWGSAGGDTDTVFQTAINPQAPFVAEAWCPSFRHVVEMQAEQKYQSVIPTGQSGHPGSPNYMNQFRLWCEGETREYSNKFHQILHLRPE